MNKKIMYLILILIIPFFTFGYEFTENFPSSKFYYENSSVEFATSVLGTEDNTPLLFDNTWYFSSGKANTKIQNQSIIINSQYGLKTSTATSDCVGSNCHSEFDYVFEDEISLYNGFLSFYCGGSSAGNFITFRDINGDDVISYSYVDNGGDECALTNAPNNCCNIDFLINDACSGSTTQVNLSFNNLSLECNDNIFNYTDIRIMGFMALGGGVGLQIDDIYLNYTNTTNQLPKYNVSINTTGICFNQSIGTITNIVQNLELDIEINAQDKEEDTILYSLSSNTENFYTVGSFTKENLESTDCYQYDILDFAFPLYSLLTDRPNQCVGVDVSLASSTPDYINLNGYCPVTENNLTAFYLTRVINQNNNPNYMLFHNPSCTGKKESLLNVRSTIGSLKDFNYNANMYFQNVNNNEFNLTFYSNPVTNDKVIQLMFRIVDSDNKNMSIYNINESGVFFLKNITYDYNVFGHLNLGVRFDYDNNNVNIYNGNKDIINTSSYDDNPSLVDYIGTSIKNGSDNKVWIENFIYGGNIRNPDFGTTYNNTITVLNEGLTSITVFVTDEFNYNKNRKFSYQTTNIYIPYCNQKINAGNSDLGKPSVKGALSLWGKIVNFYILRPMCNFTNDLTGLSNSCQYLKWFYWIVCIFFSGVVSLSLIKILGDLAFWLWGLLSSFFAMIGWLLFLDYYSPLNIVMISFLMALFGGGMFVRILTSRNG